MKFTATTLLLIEAAMAARLTQHRRANHAKRAIERKSHPKMAGTLPSEVVNQTNVEYSSNWAGVVIDSTDITEVTGIITVPSLSAGSNSDSCASAWVGIDGDSCETAILQTGLDFCYQDGGVEFDAWYEWYPDYAYDFSLDVSAGDVVKMTVTATSKTAGKAVIENQTTGKTVTKSFNGNVQGDLCLENAEWIVEDFEESGSLVAFADFGTVTFTDATATSGSGTLNPETGDILDIEQDGTVLTSCSAGNDKVTCSYV